MDIINKLDLDYKDLSSNETKLLNYFLENINLIKSKRIIDVASETFNSTAFIVRFCKKLGFSGYSEFKNYLIFLSNSLSIDYSFNASTFNIFTDIENTKNLLNESTILRILNLIHNADKIDFYGIGSSGIVCRQISQKFLLLDKQANYFDDASLMSLSASKLNSNDLVFTISMSGEKEAIIKACNIAKTKKASIVSLTNIKLNTLSSIANENLYVHSQEYSIAGVKYISRTPAQTLLEYIFNRYINYVNTLKNN